MISLGTMGGPNLIRCASSTRVLFIEIAIIASEALILFRKLGDDIFSRAAQLEHGNLTCIITTISAK